MKRSEILKELIQNGENKSSCDYLDSVYKEIEYAPYAEAFIRVLLVEAVKGLNETIGGFYYNEAELAEALFSRGYSEIEELVNKICRRVKTAAEENKAARFEKIKSYIHKNYTDSQFSLGAAASYADLSPGSTTKLFVANEGITPAEYIGKLRTQTGIDLLEKGATVTEAALQVGFASEESFIRVFKKHMGKTPGEWKRNNTTEKKR